MIDQAAAISGGIFGAFIGIALLSFKRWWLSIGLVLLGAMLSVAYVLWVSPWLV